MSPCKKPSLDDLASGSDGEYADDEGSESSHEDMDRKESHDDGSAPAVPEQAVKVETKDEMPPELVQGDRRTTSPKREKKRAVAQKQPVASVGSVFGEEVVDSKMDADGDFVSPTPKRPRCSLRGFQQQ